MTDLNIYSRLRVKCRQKDYWKKLEAFNQFLWSRCEKCLSRVLPKIRYNLISGATDNSFDIRVVGTDIIPNAISEMKSKASGYDNISLELSESKR